MKRLFVALALLAPVCVPVLPVHAAPAAVHAKAAHDTGGACISRAANKASTCVGILRGASKHHVRHHRSVSHHHRHGR